LLVIFLTLTGCANTQKMPNPPTREPAAADFLSGTWRLVMLTCNHSKITKLRPMAEEKGLSYALEVGQNISPSTEDDTSQNFRSAKFIQYSGKGILTRNILISGEDNTNLLIGAIKNDAKILNGLPKRLKSFNIFILQKGAHRPPKTFGVSYYDLR